MAGLLGLIFCLVPMLVVICAIPAVGQTSLSTIRGTVTDQSGAVVPGVQIRLEDVATNIVARTVVTDGNGNYEVPALKGGDYRLTATRTGFKTYVATDITLQSNQTKRVDVGLQVGTTSTEVTVSAAARTIETEGGSIAPQTTGKQYKIIPIPGNAYSSPLPVLATMPTLQFGHGGLYGEFDVSVAGQSGNQFDMGMDGVLEENQNTQTVNMEDAAEVKVMGINNSAEYSRIATYNVVTKRGTNELHGELSYYHRNSALAARGYFEPNKQHQIYHTFNVEAGGPIIKDKTFFYGLWNGERVSQGYFIQRTVPTASMRTGDFSQLLGLSNPIVITDPQTGLPFPANVIPPDRFSGLATTVQSDYIPQPNFGGANALTQNYAFVHPYPQDQYRADVYVARIDHKISEKNSVFGRFSAYLPRYILIGSFPAMAATKTRHSYSWAINDTHIFSPRLLNSFLFGGNVDNAIFGTTLNGVKMLNGADVVNNIGLEGVNPQGLSAAGFPTMHISGMTTLSVHAGGPTQPNKNFQYADDLTWALGRHVAKFGAQIRTFSTFDGEIPNSNYGNFSFDGRITGFGYADFLLGLPGTSTRLNPIVNRRQRAYEMGFYGTDTFKVNKRLTLTYGLRYDYFGSPTFQDGLQYNWDPSTGDVIVSQSAMNKVSPLYPSSINVAAGQPVPSPDSGNFAPRVSAAYLINENTVIRGGYGIFNAYLGRYSLSSSQGQGPFELSETFFNTIQDGQPLFSFPNPFPSGTGEVPSQSVTGFPGNTKNGFIQQYNLSLERQLGSVGLRVSYIGSKGSNLDYFIGVNLPKPSLTPFSPDLLPYPQFVGTTYQRSNGQSKYNALSVEAHRKVGGLQFDWSWTWASNLNNMQNLENPYAPLTWSHDGMTGHHRVVLGTMWEIPVGNGRRYLASMPGALNQALGGWSLYWIGFFESGQYFTPSFSGSDPSNTNSFGGLPDRVCNGNKSPGDRTLTGWFDSSCFAPPAPGRFGNSGVNILEGPGLQSQSLSITKNFPLTERVHLNFSAMISNLFNHPNFLLPDANVSVPGAGIISGQPGAFSAQRAGSRLIEGRLRLDW